MDVLKIHSYYVLLIEYSDMISWWAEINKKTLSSSEFEWTNCTLFKIICKWDFSEDIQSEIIFKIVSCYDLRK
jgi:hypothetical protein